MSAVGATPGAAPWLSVLVPVYNVEAYLEECLASVIAQADGGVEILVLNDCATDGSGALMQQLAQRWPGRLTLMAHAHNQGLSAARNTMIDAARGTYLWFLDSDDKLLPGAITTLKAIVAQAQPDVVLCDFQMWRARTRLKHRLRGELHRRSFAGPARQLLREPCAAVAQLLLPGQLHAWSKVSRRALWGADLRFPVGRHFEDLAAMPLLALRAHSFYYEPTPWVAYRQRANSILATMNPRKALDQSHALLAFRKALDASPCRDHAELRFALAHQAARSLLGALRHLQGGATADAEADVQQVWAQFDATSPLSKKELLAQYLRRGWLIRRHKLARAFRTRPVA